MFPRDALAFVAGLAAAATVAACATTTSESRSDPQLAKTTTVGELFIDDHPEIALKANADHVVLVAAEVQRCAEKLHDEYTSTVTTRTVVNAADKEHAKVVATAGVVAIGVGALGLIVTPVVLYDPHQLNGSALVPVASQTGTALWPFGVAVTVLGAVVGVPALLAPMIVGAEEKTETTAETTTKDRVADKPNCTHGAPIAQQRIDIIIGDKHVDGPTTDADGTANPDVGGFVDDLLPEVGSTASRAATIDVEPANVRADVALVITDGAITGVRVASTHDAIELPIVSARAKKWNEVAARERSKAATAAAKAEAEEAQRRATAEAEAARAEALKPKDPTQYRLVSLMRGDVYDFFDIAQPETALKKKIFEQSDDFAAKRTELRQRQQAAREQIFEIDAGKIGDFDVERGGFVISFGSNVGSLGTKVGRDWAPHCIGGFLLENVPMVKMSTPPMKPIWYSEATIVHMSERDAVRIEGRNVHLFVRFKPTEVKEMKYVFYNFAIRNREEALDVTADRVAGTATEVMLRDVDTGETVYDEKL